MSMQFRSDNLYPGIIPHHARFSANEPAVVCGDQRLTWSQLELRTRKVANALASIGVVKGDKVCIYMGDSVCSFELTWGIIRSGAVLVALNVMVMGDALATMIGSSDSVVLFTDAEHAECIKAIEGKLSLRIGRIFVSGAVSGSSCTEEFIENGDEKPLEIAIDPEDTMNIVYTSGTTGLPKGIEHTHRARLAYTLGFGHWFKFDGTSVTLLATPLFTNGSWQTLAPAMYRGGCIVLMSKFSAGSFLELVQQHRCTHVFLVPTQIVSILAHPTIGDFDVSSLQVIESAGQALMSSTFDELQRRFANTEIWEVYGMSEGYATVIGPIDYEKGKRGSVGRPAMLDDIRIVDDDGHELATGLIGEICGYGPSLMKGYYNDAQRTAEVTWLGPQGRTYIRGGDLGRLDEDGYLYICGRSKDMIKSGGINVYPVDIEEVFSKHPVVQEVAVIGVPHEKWIETPKLFAILRSAAVVDSNELMTWGNAKLAKYQRVTSIEFVADFPRVTYGKVDKKRLRAAYWPANGENRN